LSWERVLLLPRRLAGCHWPFAIFSSVVLGLGIIAVVATRSSEKEEAADAAWLEPHRTCRPVRIDGPWRLPRLRSRPREESAGDDQTAGPAELRSKEASDEIHGSSQPGARMRDQDSSRAWSNLAERSSRRIPTITNGRRRRRFDHLRHGRLRRWFPARMASGSIRRPGPPRRGRRAEGITCSRRICRSARWTLEPRTRYRWQVPGSASAIRALQPPQPGPRPHLRCRFLGIG